MIRETNNNIKCTIAMGALQHVMDPEIGLSVIDLGLVYKINFNEGDRSIDVDMTLTTQFCPMGESIIDGVRAGLEDTFKGDVVNINLVFEPRWNHDMISDEGREFLNQ